MGLDAEECFTKHDIARKVKDGVGGKVMKLESLKMKKSSEEGVDGES